TEAYIYTSDNCVSINFDITAFLWALTSMARELADHAVGLLVYDLSRILRDKSDNTRLTIKLTTAPSAASNAVVSTSPTFRFPKIEQRVPPRVPVCTLFSGFTALLLLAFLSILALKYSLDYT